MLRYLAGTVDYGLDYRRSDGVRLIGFTDSDWAGSVADRKSISTCCFSLGSATMSWFSRKRKSVGLISASAEYIEASHGSCKGLWLHKLLVDLFDQELRPAVIYYDNQSCIQLSQNHLFQGRSKHIEIGYNFIHDYV